jgi:hypothetical protein
MTILWLYNLAVQDFIWKGLNLIIYEADVPNLADRFALKHS